MIANLISKKTILLIVIREIGLSCQSCWSNKKNDKEKNNDDKVTLRSVLTAHENFFSCFFVFVVCRFCIVPVSNLLDMYSSIWQGVFSSKFLFATDPKPKFGWRVFRGPRSPKTIHVLGDPKRFTKTLQCCWGCLVDLAMPLGLSNFQKYI